MKETQKKDLVSNGKQQSIFAETFSKLFKENKESNMFDRFSSLSSKEKILAVSVAGAIFASALPILAVALPLAVPGVIVALTLFFAVKAVQYGYEGLKWSADKTVKGAENIRDSAMHLKDKVKEGYEHSVDSLKRGASFVGEGVANKFHKASGKMDYLDKIKRFTPEELKKSDEIRNDMKEIFADKGNNSGLVKNILSGISSKIDSKIAEEAKSGWEENTPKWRVQKEFINNLNEKSLHSLLTQRSLPKGSYFIDSVFSDHHDEIKEVIKECKENHLHSSVSNMFNTAERKANKPSLKSLTRSVSFSLLRKSPKQSASLSRSSSLNSIGTKSTATVDPRRLSRSHSFSGYDSPKLTPVAPPELPRSHSLLFESTSSFGSFDDSGRGSSSPSTPERKSDRSLRNQALIGEYLEDLKEERKQQKPPTSTSKPPRSPSPDSGFNSPSSSPKRLSLFAGDSGDLSKAKSKLRKVGQDKLVEQQVPSTKVDGVESESTQVKTVG